MLSSWQELLELARHGEEAHLRLAVAERCATLLARAPRPEALEPYGRRVLHRSDQGEVMLAGWPRGGRSAPHDHGHAAGLVLVLDGHFSETSYAFDGAKLLGAGTRRYAPFDCLRASPGVIHDMHAEAEGASLHFYLPAIRDMRVYDAQQRATFVVTGKSGAWLPRSSDPVCARVSWQDAPRAP
jgi:predicted metal-dependent enzyme (double-stranded beta helix superfamily)